MQLVELSRRDSTAGFPKCSSLPLVQTVMILCSKLFCCPLPFRCGGCSQGCALPQDSCRTGLHADLRRSHESGFVRKPLENEEVTEPFALSGTLSCLMLKDFRGSHTFSGGMSTAFQELCMCAADFKLQSQNSQTFLRNAFRNP